jgi:hypothetical protein
MDLPVDRELGLSGGFSLGTVATIVQLCAMLAFGNARRLFREFHEWAPSPRATLRMVDAVGAEARGFLDAAGAPEDDGEVLVIQVDGRGAPMIAATEAERRRKRRGTKRHRRRKRRREHPRPRRKKGDKSKNAKVAFVGVLYPARLRGTDQQASDRHLREPEALFRWLHEHAVRRGYGNKRALFLADALPKSGACRKPTSPTRYRALTGTTLPRSSVWQAACLHREGSQELAVWVAEQQNRLRRGNLADLSTELSGQWDDFHDHLANRVIKLAARPVPVRTHDANSQQLREAA